MPGFMSSASDINEQSKDGSQRENWSKPGKRAKLVRAGTSRRGTRRLRPMGKCLPIVSDNQSKPQRQKTEGDSKNHRGTTHHPGKIFVI